MPSPGGNKNLIWQWGRDVFVRNESLLYHHRHHHHHHTDDAHALNPVTISHSKMDLADAMRVADLKIGRVPETI